MTYQALIGKQAPSLSLPNYTGETFTLTPGEKGLPIALFFYPKSGNARLQLLSSSGYG